VVQPELTRADYGHSKLRHVLCNVSMGQRPASASEQGRPKSGHLGAARRATGAISRVFSCRQRLVSDVRN
jgi:hypothetical protein